MSIISVSDVKIAMGISGSGQDTFLQSLIDRVEAEVQNNICFRQFAAANYTEYYDGHGQTGIMVKNTPVVSVTAIHDDILMAYGADTLIDASDYKVFNDLGLIEIVSGYCFVNARKNVRVQYRGGYGSGEGETAVPKDLCAALIKLVYAEYLTLRASSNVIEGSNEDKPKRLREEALQILKGYVRIR